MFCVGNKRPATEHAAVWVPDSEAQTCMHCLKVKFTPIQRRVSSVTTPFLFPSFFSLCLSSLTSLSFSLSPSLSLFLSPFLPPSLPPFLPSSLPPSLSLSPQHHCRKCGAVVCGGCSNKKFVLSYQSDKPVRVCITCFEVLSNAAPDKDK